MTVKTTMSIRQFAALMGVSYSAAYVAARNDKLPVPCIRIGGRMVIPVRPVLDLLSIDELPENILKVS